MPALILYGFLPAVLLTAGLTWLVSARLRRSTLGRGRRSLWAGVAVGALLVLGGTSTFLVRRIRQGVRFCDVCGIHERQVRLNDWILARTPLGREDAEAWMTRDYAAWYDEHAALAHEHGWVTAGEQSAGFAQLARRYEFPPTFHRGVPKIPEPEVARALVAHLAHAPPGERVAMLQDFAQESSREGPASLMRSLLSEAVTPERFRSDYPLWLAEHPLWSDP